MSDSDFNNNEKQKEICENKENNNDGNINFSIKPKQLIFIQALIITVLIAVIALFPVLNKLNDNEQTEPATTNNQQQERVVKPHKHLTKKQLRKIRREKKRQIRKAKSQRKKQIRQAKRAQKKKIRAAKKKQRQQRRAARRAQKAKK